ncbi:MAG: hypothetical protein V1720_20835 [bacterium]
MKKLDFNPVKTGKEFRDNYKLHDLAEEMGKNLLVQWGIDFREFGKDRRFERVWEKGEDKPDLIITHNLKDALLDWKAKKKPEWIANERAVKSYERWKEKLVLPVIIVFMVFDEQQKLLEKRFAVFSQHQFKYNQRKEWDKNSTVKFENELPEFTKANLLKYLFNS